MKFEWYSILKLLHHELTKITKLNFSNRSQSRKFKRLLYDYFLICMHYSMSEHVQQKRIFWTWLRFGICQTCHLVVNLKMPEMTIFDQNREKLKWSQIQILPNQRNPSRNITKSFNFKFLVESLWCRYLNLNRLSQKWN